MRTTTLHRLLRLLGCQDAVRLSAGRLTLDPQICTVDVWGFERALRGAVDQEAVESVLDLYCGPFMGDDPNPWALSMRERLEQLIARKCGRGRGVAAVRRPAAAIGMRLLGVGA